MKKQVKLRSAAGRVKRPKLVATGCLGICPKCAVTVARAVALQRGEYLLLDDFAQAADALETLMGPETT